MVQYQVLFKMYQNHGLNEQTQSDIESILSNHGIHITEIHLTQYCTNENDPDHISFVFPNESRLRYNTEYCQARPCRDPASRDRVGFATPEQGTEAKTYLDDYELVFNSIIKLIIKDEFYLSKFNINAYGKNKKYKKSKKRKSKKRKSIKRKTKRTRTKPKK